MPLADSEKRRIGRAIWAYSGLKQPDLAEAAGMTHDRLRAALNDENKSAPTTDELLLLAEAAGVPRHIAVDGWGPDDDVRERLAQMEAAVTELRAAIVALSADSLRRTREQREQDETDRPGEHPGEGG